MSPELHTLLQTFDEWYKPGGAATSAAQRRRRAFAWQNFRAGAHAAEASVTRQLEQSLAYEQAASVIESHCVRVDAELTGTAWPEYYDLDSAQAEGQDFCIDDEVRYLDARGLLLHHEQNPRWVTLHDESESQPTPEPQ